MTSKNKNPATAASKVEAASTQLALVNSRLTKVIERATAHCIELVGKSHEKFPAIAGNVEWLPMRDGKPLAGEDMDQWWSRASSEHAWGEIRLGIALLIQEATLDKDLFKAWCRSRDISAPRASEFKNLARLFGTQHTSVLAQVVTLQAHVQRKIASLPPKLVEQIATDGTLDLLQQMPQGLSIQTIATIKRLSTELEKRNQELDEIEHSATEGSGRLRERLPESVERARILGTAHSVACTTSIDKIESLVMNLMDGSDLSRDGTERPAQLRAGVAPLYVALRGVMARTQQALKTLESNLGKFIPETGGALLSADELRAAHEALKVMQVEIPGSGPRVATKREAKPGRRRAR